MAAFVTAVSRSKAHTFSKVNELTIRLVAGFGVEGDAHMGRTVKHRHHAKKNPNAPNLRQVHLLPEELFDQLRTEGFSLQPGAIGENVTTRGIDLLALPNRSSCSTKRYTTSVGLRGRDRDHGSAQPVQTD
jgi:MOSC domain-containing protein YiiM